MGVIYKYQNTITNLPYVGGTSNELERKHSWKKLNRKYAGEKLEQARQKYGLSCWEYQVLEDNVSDEDLPYRERYWIEKLDSINNGYNTTTGGDRIAGGRTEEEHEFWSDVFKRAERTQEWKDNISKSLTGKERSKEHCEHLSQALKGRTAWNKGMKMTDEQKKVISETTKAAMNRPEVKSHLSAVRKGKTQSAEHVEKRASQLRGQTRSEETKRRMSEARKAYWERRRNEK